MRFKKKWKKVLQPDKGKYGIYKKTGIVLLLSIVMFSAVYVTDNHRQLAQDENGNRILERKGQGEGKKTENIQMETGEWKEKIKVQISEKKYAKEEIGEQLSKAAEELPTQILGENKSLDEVRSDLNLIMEIPHTGISVSWELDNYEVMNSRGVLKKEKLTEEYWIPGTEEINVVIEYKIKIPVPLLKSPSVKLKDEFKVSAWNGYQKDRKGNEDGQIVYITEKGTVWHSDYQCSYLQLSIQYVQYSELQNMRNEGGGKYHKCEQCVYGKAMNGVYITSYGNRYHNSLNCSSLKRTIRAVHKSEVAGRGGCSKCAK